MKIKSVNKFLFDIFGFGTKEATERQQLALSRAYDKLFNSDDGQLVLADLMKRAGMGETAYNYKMKKGNLEFIEGSRAIVLYILATIESTEIMALQKFAASKKIKE
jgi:hypothetical protein